VTAGDEYLEEPASAPCFIGGITGRSGTTWLRNLLDRTCSASHAVIGEHGTFVLSQFRHAPYEYFQTTRSRASYLDYLRGFLTGPAYMRDREMMGPKLRGLSALLPRSALERAIDRMFGRWEDPEDLDVLQRELGRLYLAAHNFDALVRTGASRWISKEPGYGRHLDELFELMPGARVVVTVRDGRSSALSMVDRGWHSDVSRALSRWAAFAGRALTAARRAPADRVLFVAYEEMVTSFEPTVERIFDFFRIPDGSRSLEGLPEELAPDASSLGRWEGRLSPGEERLWEETGARIQEELAELTAR
jgi:hypothetical protein